MKRFTLFQPTGKLDALLHFVEGATGFGFSSGAALAAIVEQFILAALALGMFLRFKRGRVRK